MIFLGNPVYVVATFLEAIEFTMQMFKSKGVSIVKTAYLVWVY